MYRRITAKSDTEGDLPTKTILSELKGTIDTQYEFSVQYETSLDESELLDEFEDINAELDYTPNQKNFGFNDAVVYFKETDADEVYQKVRDTYR